VDDAEAFREAVAPLEVVEQRPDEVAPQVDARLDRPARRQNVIVQVSDAEHVRFQVPGSRCVGERGAVLGDVERNPPETPAYPIEDLRQRGGVDLPARFGSEPPLQDLHCRRRQSLRSVAHDSARVVVDPEEVDRLPDPGQVRRGPRPRLAEGRGQLSRVPPEKDRIEILTVYVGVRPGARVAVAR